MYGILADNAGAAAAAAKSFQSCPTLCNPMGYSLPGSSVHGIFPGKNTGVGCHFLLQGEVGIFSDVLINELEREKMKEERR